MRERLALLLRLVLVAGVCAFSCTTAFILPSLTPAPAAALSRNVRTRTIATYAAMEADDGDVLPVGRSTDWLFDSIRFDSIRFDPIRRRSSPSSHTHPYVQGLVCPAWLEAHLDDPDLSILDVRGEVAKGQVQPDGSQVCR